jgi:hypothetical protein
MKNILSIIAFISSLAFLATTILLRYNQPERCEITESYDDAWLRNELMQGNTVRGKTLYLNKPIPVMYGGSLDSCVFYITKIEAAMKSTESEESFSMSNCEIRIVKSWEDLIPPMNHEFKKYDYIKITE